MGRVARRAACALLMALVFAPAASAHVGGEYSLRFEWPADGMLSSPFGARTGGFHPGIDIGTLRDLTVRAATAGRVVGAGSIPGYDGYGNVVVLSLGGGLTSIYAHLARPSARVGELVQAGQVIGEAGCTGWCTGTHLHFELRYRGTPVDPLGLFDAPLG
jgi:murein DD-endopeptidase MepM/ murein hydrolase activator NlpD